MTQPKTETLPEEILWAEGGHASDVALTTIADGELALLPPKVLAHVNGCATCTQHLGHAALLSLHVAREMAAIPAHERALATARRPLPRLAIATGLAVALLALVPTLADGPSLRGVWTDAATLGRVLRAVAHAASAPGSALGLLLTYGTAAALVVSAFVVVKILPRKEVSS